MCGTLAKGRNGIYDIAEALLEFAPSVAVIQKSHLPIALWPSVPTVKRGLERSHSGRIAPAYVSLSEALAGGIKIDTCTHTLNRQIA